MAARDIARSLDEARNWSRRAEAIHYRGISNASWRELVDALHEALDATRYKDPEAFRTIRVGFDELHTQHRKGGAGSKATVRIPPRRGATVLWEFRAAGIPVIQFYGYPNADLDDDLGEEVAWEDFNEAIATTAVSDAVIANSTREGIVRFEQWSMSTGFPFKWTFKRVG
jgi:hypothetical protein